MRSQSIHLKPLRSNDRSQLSNWILGIAVVVCGLVGVTVYQNATLLSDVADLLTQSSHAPDTVSSLVLPFDTVVGGCYQNAQTQKLQVTQCDLTLFTNNSVPPSIQVEWNGRRYSNSKRCLAHELCTFDFTSTVDGGLQNLLIPLDDPEGEKHVELLAVVLDGTTMRHTGTYSSWAMLNRPINCDAALHEGQLVKFPKWGQVIQQRNVVSECNEAERTFTSMSDLKVNLKWLSSKQECTCPHPPYNETHPPTCHCASEVDCSQFLDYMNEATMQSIFQSLNSCYLS